MTIYAIGDLHLSGEPPVKPMNIFSPLWENHWERIRTHWLETVTNDDIVLLAGDISWAMSLSDAAPDLQRVAALPGKKLMIRGNHDFWWQSQSKNSALTGDAITYIKSGAVLLPDGTAICGTRGWYCPDDPHFKEDHETPYRREKLRMEEALKAADQQGAVRKIMLLHHPPFYRPDRGSEFLDILSSYGVTTCVFGHIHGLKPRTLFPRIYQDMVLQLVSADYSECRLQRVILTKEEMEAYRNNEPNC